MIYALAALIAFALALITRLDTGTRLSPDGRFYVEAGNGKPVPTPYRFRWLLPVLCRDSATRWKLMSLAALTSYGPLMAWYLDTMEPWQQIAGVVLLCGLPGLFRINAELPVLVDAPAFALALASASCWMHGWTWAALGLAVAAGASKETAPVFAALFAWHPALLIGLAGAAWLSTRGPVPKWAEAWLKDPIRGALNAHKGAWLDWAQTALPWGALAVLAPMAAGLTQATTQAGAALAVGYGQMLAAQDRARLFQWAAPCVIALALTALTPEWAVVACGAHLLNPYRGV